MNYRWVLFPTNKGCPCILLCSQVAASIETSAQALGHACLSLVKAAGIVQSSPNDNLGKKDLVDNSRIVSDKVSAF